MEPDRFVLGATAGDAVVTRVEHRLACTSERAEEPFGNQRAAGLRPSHRVIVQQEVARGGIGFRGSTARTVTLDVDFEDRLSESARPAVDERDEFVLVETQRGEG